MEDYEADVHALAAAALTAFAPKGYVWALVVVNPKDDDRGDFIVVSNAKTKPQVEALGRELSRYDPVERDFFVPISKVGRS